MNFFIIIRGPLGVGKTTISKLLAQKLNATYFSVDQILEENKLDFIDKKIGCISEKNFFKVNQIIIDNILKNNKTAVIDGNFYYQNQIKDLIKNIPFKSFVFTLMAPVELCLKRDTKRLLPHGKQATLAVYNLVAKFEYGETINVSNLSIDESVQKIYSKII
jgi:shikimate kinase